MNFETIKVEINGPLGRLTLNRPERLNAMNATMLRELVEAARWFPWSLPRSTSTPSRAR
jgi:enoyl-CoA hydratase